MKAYYLKATARKRYNIALDRIVGDIIEIGEDYVVIENRRGVKFKIFNEEYEEYVEPTNQGTLEKWIKKETTIK